MQQLLRLLSRAIGGQHDDAPEWTARPRLRTVACGVQVTRPLTRSFLRTKGRHLHRPTCAALRR